MNKRYDYILFDMDGTIADTDEMVLKSFYKLYDTYKNGNRRPDEEIYYFSGPPIKETLKNEFPEYDLDFIFDRFYEISQALYDETVKPIKNCREVLLKFKEAGIKMAVVTNKMRDPAFRTLKIVGLEDIFDEVIGCNSVKKGKPSPEGIEAALKVLGCIDKSKVLYVGDNAIDDLTAKNAGVDSCICYWGPRKMPIDLNPTYKIFDYFDLLKEVIYE